MPPRRSLLLLLALPACTGQQLPLAAPSARELRGPVGPLAQTECRRRFDVGEAAPGRLPTTRLTLERCTTRT